jgi:uncharacterized protein YoaH (UPF0181 family)
MTKDDKKPEISYEGIELQSGNYQRQRAIDRIAELFKEGKSEDEIISAYCYYYSIRKLKEYIRIAKRINKVE